MTDVPKRQPLQIQMQTIADQLDECAASLEKLPAALPAHARIVRNGAQALRLAGEAIAQLRADHAEEIREMQRDMRDAISEAVSEARSRDDERW